MYISLKVRREENFGNLGADGRMIIKWILQNQILNVGSMDWIEQGQDRVL
jgi:hypothetical protein